MLSRSASQYDPEHVRRELDRLDEARRALLAKGTNKRASKKALEAVHHLALQALARLQRTTNVRAA